MAPSFYESALKIVLEFEGGFSDHPLDRGGATKCGVTQQTYDTYRQYRKLPSQSVGLIKIHEIEWIYKFYFWQPAGCNFLPYTLAVIHFDHAVNRGVVRANKVFQRLIEAKDDGVFGPKTIKAKNAALERYGIKVLLNAYLLQRENIYRIICKDDPTQEVFLQGWLNRVNKLREILQ